jgi:hypothetical protein
MHRERPLPRYCVDLVKDEDGGNTRLVEAEQAQNLLVHGLSDVSVGDVMHHHQQVCLFNKQKLLQICRVVDLK